METHHATPPVAQDYPTALQEGVQQMVGLMGALLRSVLPVRSEITGGQDSRCVLSALLAAHGKDPQPIGHRVQFRCGEHAPDDFSIASELSRDYGLHLNSSLPGLTSSIDAEDAYARWRRNEMGLNGAITPPISHRRLMTLNGVGGGANRLVYKAPSMTKQLLWNRSPFLTEEDRRALAEAMEESLTQISEHPDPRITHYRAFRNRFHGGRVPLHLLSLSPLDSPRSARGGRSLARRGPRAIATQRRHTPQPDASVGAASF
ncbi:hypothetical protein BJF82_10145 [Kytococcus sp. CUA-901]|nr:hypothetical protein BJF82_10145 [Kytococcus sp. CUA-901]